MGKVRPGNSTNSKLNGEWATHVRGDMKKTTSRLRRIEDKKTTVERLVEFDQLMDDWYPCSLTDGEDD
jgi:hypothetical protein